MRNIIILLILTSVLLGALFFWYFPTNNPTEREVAVETDNTVSGIGLSTAEIFIVDELDFQSWKADAVQRWNTLLETQREALAEKRSTFEAENNLRMIQIRLNEGKLLTAKARLEQLKDVALSAAGRAEALDRIAQTNEELEHFDKILALLESTGDQPIDIPAEYQLYLNNQERLTREQAAPLIQRVRADRQVRVDELKSQRALLERDQERRKLDKEIDELNREIKAAQITEFEKRYSHRRELDLWRTNGKRRLRDQWFQETMDSLRKRASFQLEINDEGKFNIPAERPDSFVIFAVKGPQSIWLREDIQPTEPISISEKDRIAIEKVFKQLEGEVNLGV